MGTSPISPATDRQVALTRSGPAENRKPLPSALLQFPGIKLPSTVLQRKHPHSHTCYLTQLLPCPSSAFDSLGRLQKMKKSESSSSLFYRPSNVNSLDQPAKIISYFKLLFWTSFGFQVTKKLIFIRRQFLLQLPVISQLPDWKSFKNKWASLQIKFRISLSFQDDKTKRQHYVGKGDEKQRKEETRKSHKVQNLTLRLEEMGRE